MTMYYMYICVHTLVCTYLCDVVRFTRPCFVVVRFTMLLLDSPGLVVVVVVVVNSPGVCLAGTDALSTAHPQGSGVRAKPLN